MREGGRPLLAPQRRKSAKVKRAMARAHWKKGRVRWTRSFIRLLCYELTKLATSVPLLGGISTLTPAFPIFPGAVFYPTRVKASDKLH